MQQNDKLAIARRIAAQASSPVRVAPGVGGPIAHMADGSIWGPLNGRPMQLISRPRVIGMQWLRRPDYDTMAASEAEQRAARKVAA